MKKIMAIFLLLLATYSLPALRVNIGGDLRSFDSFVVSDSRIDFEIGVEVDNLKIIIPVRYGKSSKYDLSLVETGLLVSLSPWENLGFFAEASIVKAGLMWGIYAPKEKAFFSLEGSIGWEFVFGSFYIRPKYTYRSTLSGETAKDEVVRTIKQFGESRISLFIGVLFGGKK